MGTTEPWDQVRVLVVWSKQDCMAEAERKDKRYWIDEITFLEARLTGSQGDIDRNDRAACEDALKAAQAKLKACSD